MATQMVRSVPLAECEVCGREICECPRPLGECSECHAHLWESDPWGVDLDGVYWCQKCWPGADECWPGVES
jgi:hypothetical protein